MKISKILGTLSTFGSTLFLTASAYAQDSGLGGYLPDSVIGDQSVVDVIERGIRLAILLAALVCVAVLVGAGYSYITAAGDEQKVEKATKTLTYAIVGLVICFIAVILVQFVLTNLLEADASLLRLYV